MRLQKGSKIAAFALVVVVTISLFGISNGLEIRSKTIPASDGNYRFTANSGGIGSSGASSMGFYGFYYDIDEDLGLEEIIINVVDGEIDGKNRPEGLIYKTSKQSKSFEFGDWGEYFSIGFMGENYFAGYNGTTVDGEVPYLYRASHHKDVISSQMLLKVLIDSDSEKTFDNSHPLQLEDGYELVLESIDSSGDKAHLSLLKNGVQVYSSTISCRSENENDRTFKYTESISNVDDLVILAVHFDSLMSGDSGKIAQVDGIFQLSDNPEQVDLGSKHGILKVSRCDPDGIEMKNSEKSIKLRRGLDTQIMGSIWLRVGDPGEDYTPNMHLYSNIIEPGIYEIRGEVHEIIENLEKLDYDWNYTTFSGFFYDLDSNLGSEDMIALPEIKNSGDTVLYPDYYTYARTDSFQFNEWGSYYLIGFMGEKCFAGYAKKISDRNLSLAFISGDDETNLLSRGKLSRILIDSDEQLQPVAAGRSIQLDEGYVLKLKEIDSEKIALDLEKNGSCLDANRIVDLKDRAGGTYAYCTRIDSNTKLVTLAIHFKNTFSTDPSLATIDGIWQISDEFIPVEYGSSSGIMKIKDITVVPGDMSITMNSDDRTIRAVKGKTQNIMGDYYLRFADQDDNEPLRFYIMKSVTIEPSAIP